MAHFRFDVADGVATVTFDRPDRLNALTLDVYADLRDLFVELEHRDDVAVVVVRGEGRGFCSGGDVGDIIGRLLDGGDQRDVLEFTRMTGAVVQRMRECPKPIIAALNGVAAGAGAVIALASDFRLLARSASFRFLFSSVGLAGADMGCAWLLPRIVGAGRATEILMLGDKVTADDALSYGLANRVVDNECPGRRDRGAGPPAGRRPDVRLRRHQAAPHPRGRHEPPGRHRARGLDAGLPDALRRPRRVLQGPGREAAPGLDRPVTMAAHQFLNPEGLAPPIGFSHVAVAAPGRLVFLAGETAHQADGTLSGSTLPEQFAAAADNVATALAAAGATPGRRGVAPHLHHRRRRLPVARPRPSAPPTGRSSAPTTPRWPSSASPASTTPTPWSNWWPSP